MITLLVEEYLSAYLQGHRSADDTRQILRLIDDTERKGGALVAEFDRTLSAVSKKIPGLSLNFDNLLAGDKIECDPLISQGNLALLRLDAIFRQAFTAWTHSGSSLHTIKRIAKPENPETYSDRTQQHIRTEETYPPNARLINQIVNIALSGFRIQATITHRRDQLKFGKQSDPQVSRDATQTASSPSQPEASARNAAQSNSPPESNSDIITADEILDGDFDLKPLPIFGPIQGFRRLGKLGPLVNLCSSTLHQPPATGPSPNFSAPPRETHSQTANNVSLPTREDEPVTSEHSKPRATCPDCGTPRPDHAEATNNVSPEPREEEPVTLELSVPSAFPRGTQSFTHNQPFYHKRE